MLVLFFFFFVHQAENCLEVRKLSFKIKCDANLGLKVVILVQVGFHYYVHYGFYCLFCLVLYFNCITILIGFTDLLRVKNKQERKRISQVKSSFSKCLEKRRRAR